MLKSALIYKGLIVYKKGHLDESEFKLTVKEIKEIASKQGVLDLKLSNKDILDGLELLSTEGLIKYRGKSTIYVELLGKQHFDFTKDIMDLELDLETEMLFEILYRKAFLGVAEINKIILEEEIQTSDGVFEESIKKLVESGYISILKEEKMNMQILVFDCDEEKELSDEHKDIETQGIVASSLMVEPIYEKEIKTDLDNYLNEFDETMDVVASCMNKAIKAQERVSLLMDVIENLRAEKRNLEAEAMYLRNSNNKYRMERLERI